MGTSKKVVNFRVTLELPEGATITNACEYVRDAVAAWHGSLKAAGVDHENPDDFDPMFYLDDATIRVKRLKR